MDFGIRQAKPPTRGRLGPVSVHVDGQRLGDRIDETRSEPDGDLVTRALRYFPLVLMLLLMGVVLKYSALHLTTSTLGST